MLLVSYELSETWRQTVNALWVIIKNIAKHVAVIFIDLDDQSVWFTMIWCELKTSTTAGTCLCISTKKKTVQICRHTILLQIVCCEKSCGAKGAVFLLKSSIVQAKILFSCRYFHGLTGFGQRRKSYEHETWHAAILNVLSANCLIRWSLLYSIFLLIDDV